jgi:SAM-dependent MidA family methyltransferase
MAESANPVENNDEQTLQSLIKSFIVQQPEQRITFAKFMEMVLYHPSLGYYVTKAAAIGRTGDFCTAPHLAADFGELLAEQFVQMWEHLQCPKPFILVEMGAGQGILAADILGYLRRRFPDFCQCLEYWIVDRSQRMIALQRQQLNSLLQAGVALRWCSLEEIASNSITGCFFSNELVDAFPVHRVRLKHGQLQEVYVTVEATSGELQEVTAELSTPLIADYFSLVEIDLNHAYPDGYTTEVNLAALDWLIQVSRCLQRGYLLTIDYGYVASRYYAPARQDGTLQCYYQHSFHSNPYLNIGKQDITAHADLTALERWGEQQGLHTVGLLPQGVFLMALGLGDRLATLGQSDSRAPQAVQTLLQRREALQALINPMGMGNFWVLVQSKGLAKDVPILRGLEVPP